MPTDEWPHLSNAPITEAVIEFQFAISDNVTIDMLRKVADELKASFPQQDEKRSSFFKAVMTPSGPETEMYDQGVVGISVKSEDGNKIVQLLRDRFAFSHLPPYKNWELLEEDAIAIWNIFLEKTNIGGINRVGVRFINRIELEVPFSDFNDYLVAAPIIPVGLPQALGAFNMQLAIPNHEIGADAIVNMSMGGWDKEKNIVPVFLDIDVGKVGNIDVDKESLHNILVGLRKYKNELFFRNITENVVRKYK